MNTLIADLDESAEHTAANHGEDPRGDERPAARERKPSFKTAGENAGYDAYALYMREVCQHKLLTAEEEVALGRCVRRGDQAARERMILANLRLVVKIARAYESSDAPLLDLINEGNIGLTRAVDLFDPERGSRFSTYAAFWIKQRIRRCLMNQIRTVRLPVHLFERSARSRRVAAQLHSELEREPTTEEVANRLGSASPMVARLFNSRLSITSLDAPLSDDIDETRANLFPDERSPDPVAEAEKSSQFAVLDAALQSLTPRERAILRDRFGLENREEHTLEQIARRMGLTRERIRQIQFAALEKLRQRIGEAGKNEALRRQFAQLQYLLLAKAA